MRWEYTFFLPGAMSHRLGWLVQICSRSLCSKVMMLLVVVVVKSCHSRTSPCPKRNTFPHRTLRRMPIDRNYLLKIHPHLRLLRSEMQPSSCACFLPSLCTVEQFDRVSGVSLQSGAAHVSREPRAHLCLHT